MTSEICPPMFTMSIGVRGIALVNTNQYYSLLMLPDLRQHYVKHTLGSTWPVLFSIENASFALQCNIRVCTLYDITCDGCTCICS